MSDQINPITEDYPLAGLVLPQGPGFRLSLAAKAARFVVRGEGAEIKSFGTAIPPMLGVAQSGHRAALRIGPDEFLLLAAGEDADQVESVISANSHFGVIDVSDRQIGLIAEGALAARCLSAGCPLDFRLPAFPVGRAVRTVFLKTEVILWRQEHERFHIEIWRSFAPYLIGHLSDAYAGTVGIEL